MTNLIHEPQAFVPGPDAVAFYRVHGWYIASGVLSDEELAAARRGADRFYTGSVDFKLPAVLPAHSDWNANEPHGLRINDYISLRNREIGRLVTESPVAAIAARLMGSAVIRLFTTSLIVKRARQDGGERRIGWHADKAYCQTCTSERMMTAWVPLQDCTIQMVVLRFVDKSHQRANIQALRDLFMARTFMRQDLEGTLELLRAAGLAPTVVEREMKAGDVSFHNCWTLHASGPNHSATDRYAVSIHLQDGENMYRQVSADDPAARGHKGDSMVARRSDGTPDYADPVFCPVLWSDDNHARDCQ